MATTLGAIPDVLLPVLPQCRSGDRQPYARSLRALEILRARPDVRAGELAQRLGVTERAARRYVGILTTRVVFEAPLDDVAPWTRAPLGRLEPSATGCVLTGSTSNPPMYAQEWMAAIPFPFRVEGGPELRVATAALAARLAAAVPSRR